jgi:hypothetical protein
LAPWSGFDPRDFEQLQIALIRRFLALVFRSMFRVEIQRDESCSVAPALPRRVFACAEFRSRI